MDANPSHRVCCVLSHVQFGFSVVRMASVSAQLFSLSTDAPLRNPVEWVLGAVRGLTAGITHVVDAETPAVWNIAVLNDGLFSPGAGGFGGDREPPSGETRGGSTAGKTLLCRSVFSEQVTHMQTHTNTQTHKHTITQSHKHTQTHTETHTQKHTRRNTHTHTLTH